MKKTDETHPPFFILMKALRSFSVFVFTLCCVVSLSACKKGSPETRPSLDATPSSDATQLKSPRQTKAAKEQVRREALAAKQENIRAGAARIDSVLMNAWKKQGLKPNAKVDDHTFVRRAYLDITGTIPTYEQTVRFIESEESTKRESLVPGLLLSDGYSSHLYNYFADLLRIQSKVPGTALRMDPFAEWLKTSLHENLPYDQLVKQMMTAQGTMRENPAAGYHLRDHGMKLDHVAYMSKAFLGTSPAPNATIIPSRTGPKKTTTSSPLIWER